jgi:F-type H+-transporting ATPase subunit b
MKRRMLALLFGVAAVALATAPVLAAEGPEGGEATSPLYTVNQGLITGLATIIIFVLLVAILGKYAWGPILSGLKAREEKIRKDIADADAARAKAEAVLREYNAQLATAEQKVRDMIAKATTDAEQLAASIRARAQQESEETKERAMRDIENAREQALAEIYAQTAELSTRIAEKILKRNINADDQRGLVNQSLQELEAVR